MNRKLFAILTAAVIVIVPAALAAADGAATYKAKCAMCHGPDGSGATPMGKSMKLRDLRSPEVRKQTDAELAKITTDGKGKMPAYKGKLTDAEISALVAHMRTLK
ncbi:MAG: cytochrome c6 [Thermoanaerobaculia bacterium]|jgi:mono/diheme cytochrome c family protein|nr:cytochrome c6 [Thermoanaerobaculia bacterium]